MNQVHALLDASWNENGDEHSAVVNAVDDQGRTPLAFSVLAGSTEIVELLL